jgi:hypothetical protein
MRARGGDLEGEGLRSSIRHVQTVPAPVSRCTFQTHPEYGYQRP